MNNETTATERTGLGAEWLDTNRPGWAAKINTDTLNTQSSCHCVLGQLADTVNGYYTFLYNLTLDDIEGSSDTVEWSIDHGFSPPDNWNEPDNSDLLFDELDELWYRLIAARV